MKSQPLVIPSVDISCRKVARISQHRVVGFEKRFKDPVAAAVFWADQGARRIHVIDIDGSGADQPVNTDVLEAIAQAVPVTIQAGGGVRTAKDAELLKRSGADLVIFRPRRSRAARLESFRGIEGMILGFDLTEEPSPLDELSSWLLSGVSALGARSLLICDVSVEGTSKGPRFPLLKKLVTSLRTLRREHLEEVEMIYAGGVSSKTEIEKLSTIGFRAVVMGTALYQGLLEFGEVA